MFIRSRTKPKIPTELDRAIGQNIQLVRISKKVTQSEVAHALGITAQQLQKYESGQNRLPASRLFLIAQILNASILDFFFDINVQIQPQ